MSAGQAKGAPGRGQVGEQTRDLGFLSAHHVRGGNVRIVAANARDDADGSEGFALKGGETAGEITDGAGRGDVGNLVPSLAGSGHAADENGNSGMGVTPRRAMLGQYFGTGSAREIPDTVRRRSRSHDETIDDEFRPEMGRTPVDGDEW